MEKEGVISMSAMPLTSGIAGHRDRIYLMKFSNLSFVSNILPAAAALVCTVVSFLVHFDSSLYTHCGVTNFLPSLSSIISQTPEKYVWKSAMALHFWPRIMIMVFYYQANRLRDTSLWTPAVELVFLMELCSLMVLSVVTSADNFSIHRNAFFAFVFFAAVHKLVRVQHSRRLLLRNYTTLRRLHKKMVAAALFFVSVTAAALLYYLHNRYCIPGLYSVFALLEYLIVVINLTFHNLVASDFNDHLIYMQPPEYYAMYNS